MRGTIYRPCAPAVRVESFDLILSYALFQCTTLRTACREKTRSTPVVLYDTLIEYRTLARTDLSLGVAASSLLEKRRIRKALHCKTFFFNVVRHPCGLSDRNTGGRSVSGGLALRETGRHVHEI